MVSRCAQSGHESKGATGVKYTHGLYALGACVRTKNFGKGRSRLFISKELAVASSKEGSNNRTRPGQVRDPCFAAWVVSVAVCSALHLFKHVVARWLPADIDHGHHSLHKCTCT